MQPEPAITPRPRCEKCSCLLKSEEAKRRGLCYPHLIEEWKWLKYNFAATDSWVGAS